MIITRADRDAASVRVLKMSASLTEADELLAMLGLPPRGSYCDSCGDKLRADNRYGICTKRPECRKIHQRRQFRALYGKRTPSLAGTPGLRFLA